MAFLNLSNAEITNYACILKIEFLKRQARQFMCPFPNHVLVDKN